MATRPPNTPACDLDDEPRLAALRRYGILDTPPEPAFDDLTRLAAHVCQAPVAVVNFIDRGRQWFKSEVGLGVRQTPLDVSICAHAILQRDLFVVPDTLLDERFRNNPLVTGEPRLRFYAGALLETPDGYPLGTLCVLDHVPRELTGDQRDALRMLARQVMAQLDLRRALADQTRVAEERERAVRRLDRDATLLANVRDSVIVTDLGGVVTFWNEGATRLFGWAAGEMVGKPLVERLPKHARADVAAAIDRIAGGEEFAGEWPDWRKDGSRVWIRAVTRRISDSAGSPVGIMGVSHDISDRKRDEAERQALLDGERAARAQAEASRAEAEAANRAKDRHLAFLAHELRGPLTPALMAAAAMAADAGLPDPLRADAAMIRRNIELTTRLADDLLDANRIALGKLELRVEPADVHESLRASVTMCAADAEAKGVRLDLDLRAVRHVADADPAKLTQVWCNLLKNAVKFTPAGGRVTARTSDAAAGRLRVEVRDTGVGVDAGLLPKLFALYEQGDRSVTREHAGLGLGLAICKGIVDAHVGTITASSEGRGRGTTMTVDLPATASPAGLPTAGPAPAPAERRPTLGLKILLVDDHEDTLRVMSRLLSVLDHRVTTATGVGPALAAAERDEFDLLISDVGLGDESGLDLMRELLKRRSIRGIALTGYGTDEDVRRTRDLGFEAHLTKPVNLEQLQALILDVRA